jgi:hypothetical protein
MQIYKAIRVIEQTFNLWRVFKHEVERDRDEQGIRGNLTDSMLLEMVIEAYRESRNDR